MAVLKVEIVVWAKDIGGDHTGEHATILLVVGSGGERGRQGGGD